jgi:hypothetical protein
MPRLRSFAQDGLIPTGDKLARLVDNLFADGYDVVIAITDVYTGTGQFVDSQDAKAKMREWVGVNPRFHPHVALHEFEAWLLPYWNRIQTLAGSNKRAPAINPETVNHDKPPSKHLADLFRTGSKSRAYVKTRDATAILTGQDLTIAISKCPELKELVNTILTAAGGTPV